jgi:SulP family sulfate permease
MVMRLTPKGLVVRAFVSAISVSSSSGVKPEQGLYTAIVAGFLISAFGGSRTQISGPTGAFVVIVYGIVAKYGYEGLALATLMAGVLLIVMGIARMGNLLKFIPYPVIVGFTSGIALLIFSSQVRDFLGLRMQAVPAEFAAKWIAYAGAAGTLNPSAAAVGVGTLLVVVFWPRVTHRVPGPFVALVVATAAVALFHLPVETIGSRFGDVPNSLPLPHLPPASFALVKELFSPAVTIALLASIESLLAAVVADGMTGTRHSSNMELVAQGIGNIASPLFLGIPATGAIARTATNIKSGGRTPFAGMIHSATLLLIMLAFGRLAALIPMPALAAVLVVVAYNMSEWHNFVKLLRAPKSDVAVLVTTFALTVVIDLTVAIQVGVVLAALLFMQRMATTLEVSKVSGVLADESGPVDPSRALDRRRVPEYVEVFEIYGSLFFGAIERFREAMRTVERRPKVLILRMRSVVSIDATGIRTIEDLYMRLHRKNMVLVLSGVRAQPREALRNAGLLDRMGRENVCDDIDAALERSEEILGSADEKTLLYG